MARQFFTPEQKQEFCNLYLTYRDSGLTSHNAYCAAKRDAEIQHRPAPAVSTFLKWLHPRSKQDQNIGVTPISGKQSEPENLSSLIIHH